ncbi:11-cis retinol dehydrogenase-like isoform X1 [Varroa jacobsoni]|nr:11-cis retinol dehydrogenase-like isoform X1 [Varroa jacobsoni]
MERVPVCLLTCQFSYGLSFHGRVRENLQTAPRNSFYIPNQHNSSYKMGWLARLLIWLVCGVISVFLSSRAIVREKLLVLAEQWRVPPWLYLSPISLTIAFLIAQIVLIVLNLVRLSSKGKAVFITGCDSGFGYHLSLKLRSQGYQVFAGCLFPEGSGAVKLLKDAGEADRLNEEGSRASKGAGDKSLEPGLTVVPCDVTSEESLQLAVKEVKSHLNGQELWAVVANAGIGTYGYLEWMSIEKIQQLFNVNTFGVIRTFQAFAPLLRKSKGRLVVTTSWSARFAPPTLVAYSMTKHAAKALCDGLRAELGPFGIQVCSIEPNMYRTSIIPVTTKELDGQWSALSAEQKESYGTKLLKRSRIMTQDFGYLCQDDLRFPMWCFEHAISARFPKTSYECDRLSTFLFSKLISSLPTEFMACFNHNIHYVLALGRNFLPGRYG